MRTDNMNSFKRILIALDLSATDQQLLQVARQAIDLFQPEKLYFTHIVPDLNFPTHVEVEFHRLFAPETPVDEKVKERLTKTVQSALGRPPGVEIEIDVIEGKPYTKLMHWLEVKHIDLLVLGKKVHSQGSGITARRVAAQAECAVLFVPEQTPASLREALVPVDFSENSGRALQTALAFRKALPDLGVTALHITELIPAGYTYNYREYDNFNQFLVEAAEQSFDDFLPEYANQPETVKTAVYQNDRGNLADRLAELAQELKADWIVLGARGHTALERFFFGSVTEKLVEGPLPVPVLIVR